jgi:SAM-dependent methyltransferase
MIMLTIISRSSVFYPFLAIFFFSFSVAHAELSLANKGEYLSDAEKAFTDIYTHGFWGRDVNGQPTSGSGSSLEEGLPFIQYVQDFLQNHNIQSVVDLGCGDWVLAQKIDWGRRNYLGIDIVEFLVKKNQSLYGSDTIHFLHMDASLEPIPVADLLICKDVLMHLPNSDIHYILSESKKYKYCLLINDINFSGAIGGVVNNDVQTGWYRHIDLTQAPFSLIPHQLSYYTSGFSIKQVVLISNE